VDKIANMVIVPFLYDMQEMNRSMLPLDQLDYIMSDELKHEYVSSGGDIVDILNAKVKFAVLAGSKMRTRKIATQALPLITQFLGNPEIVEQLALQNKKVNVKELARSWFEMAEMHNMNDMIVDMTPQEAQRHAQNSPSAVNQQKFLAQQQALQQKAATQEQQADANNVALSAREVLRAGFKKAVEPEEFTGNPNASGSGFGSF
jgi:hypothetical protein